MLYSRDGIIKDSSLITIEKDGKIIHNPSKSLLESEGWVEFSGDFSQFINKRFIKMTSDVLEGFDKEELVDTIVFLTDNNKLYLNGQYFGGEDIVVSYSEYGSNNTYVGEVNINDNSFEIGVPRIYYNDYTGGTNIGQLVVGDSSYDVYAPQTEVTYDSNLENGVLLGTLYVNGTEFPIYAIKPQEVPILSQEVTIEELNDLKKTGKLKPGQKYVVTDYRTTIDENIGKVVYQENEKHELVFTAISKNELDQDVTSLQTFKSSSEIGRLEPTGDFELIAYKCDWDPDNSIYTEDDEYYKYVGETLNIEGETYYIWNKYENGIRLGKNWGKSTIATTSLDFECSLENPYHPDYFISYDEINDNYQFEEPSEENGNDPAISDSLCRVVRIDKPVYNYYVKMQACDWDNNNGEYGYDEDSWYEYNGDTIDIDGVTYFKWNKCDYGGKVENACCPLTDTLYIDCSPENPYTPEMWVTVDNELNNEYFDEFKTDIFYQIEDSDLPDPTKDTESAEDRKPVITKVRADLNVTKTFDESQVVNAVAFKTRFEQEYPELKTYPDYEGLYLYHGETMDIDGDNYKVWDKYSNDAGEGFISIDYRKENDYFWAQILTKNLYIDCSLSKPHVQDYTITSGFEEPVQNYEVGRDKIIEITYFNNVTNYIRFENNGWYVRYPELDRDGKFGWGYINTNVLSEDGNSYSWECNSEGNWAGPIPAFVNKYNLEDNDFFLTDTLDPQVGDSFYWNSEEGGELDTIDKVWGTIIKPEIYYKGIYYMKDEFGNEASYDFKHIKFNNLYTFGNEEEDYSLNGFENGVYNNVIMKPVDSYYNRMNISSKNTYGNTFYPSCRDCIIDFSIQESIITKSDRGLHPFCPTNFVEPIVVKDLLNPLKVITYTTTNEQIVNPKTDAFGDANIITNKYE